MTHVFLGLVDAGDGDGGVDDTVVLCKAETNVRGWSGVVFNEGAGEGRRDGGGG